jgi:hypothetical protein
MLVEQMADETGHVSIETPTVEVDFSIRDEALERYESETGQLFLRMPTMDEGVYLEVVPTAAGVEPVIVVDPDLSLTPIDRTEPAEQPDVSSLDTYQYRMD